MAKKIVRRLECTCEKCGHSWVSRLRNPKMCPNCKSVHWDDKEQNETEKEEQ
jgi:predicted Zn-ribbon and HTH transcriptional regulator